MSNATTKIAFGGKLASELEARMTERKKDTDSVSRSLAEKFFTRETITRGGGVQSRIELNASEAKLFIADVETVIDLHYAKGESRLPKESRSRLVWIQAKRTRKQLEAALAS